MPVRDFDKAEIVLSGRRRLELPLLATIWLGVLAFSLAEGSVFYAVLGGAGIAVNVLVVRHHQEIYLPKLFVNIGVLGSTAVLLLELLGSGVLPLVALGHYLILIQVCKLFEHKRNRDYVQLLVLSMLCVVAGSVISGSMAFAAALLAYLAAAAYTTMVFTVKRGLDAAGSSRLATEMAVRNGKPTGHGQMSPEGVAWNVMRAWPTEPIRKRLGVVLAGVLGTGVLLFLAAPRSASSPSEAGVKRESTTGFSSTLRLGQPRRVIQSNQIMMTVAIHNPAGGPTPVAEYLRGRTYDTYANNVWSSGATGDFDPMAMSQGRRVRRFASSQPRYEEYDSHMQLEPEYSRLSDELTADSIVQRFTADAALLPTFFSVYPVVRFECGGAVPQIAADLTGSMTQASVWPTGAVDYTAWSWPMPLSGDRRASMASCDVPTGEAASTVQTTVRVASLAQEWCADLLAQRDEPMAGLSGSRPTSTSQHSRRDEIDLAIAARICEKLRTYCTYTLDLRDANPRRDGVEDFLFHMRKGHCEYFASAMAVLCRALGVQARVVTGFHVPAMAWGDGKYAVRGSDAHAWVEVWTASSLWRTFDPTPASLAEPDTSSWAGVNEFWHSLKFFWNRRVLGYDEAAREKFWAWVRGIFSDGWKSVVHAFQAVGRGVLNLLAHGYIDAAMFYTSLAVGAMSLAVFGLVLWRLLGRELHYRRLVRAGRVVTWDHLQFFSRLWLLLERRVKPAPRDLSPRQWVANAGRSLNLPEATLTELVDLYYRLRWGRTPVEPERIQLAERQVAELAQILKRHGRVDQSPAQQAKGA